MIFIDPECTACYYCEKAGRALRPCCAWHPGRYACAEDCEGTLRPRGTPDVILSHLRKALDDWSACESEHSAPATAEAAEAAIAAAVALDDWMTGGGCLPRAWARRAVKAGDRP